MFIYPGFEKLNIILASTSPRRRKLLEESGIPHRVIANDFEEDYPANLSGEEIALYLANHKSDHFKPEDYPSNSVIITADTIVWLKGEVLSKPVDKDDAVNILKKISGCMHEVITGVCIKSNSQRFAFTVKTKVYFRPMSDFEINIYLDNFSPYDKAGAYGVQEWIGHTCVSRIEGSFLNVMGFPMKEVFETLQKFIK